MCGIQESSREWRSTLNAPQGLRSQDMHGLMHVTTRFETAKHIWLQSKGVHMLQQQQQQQQQQHSDLRHDALLAL